MGGNAMSVDRANVQELIEVADIVLKKVGHLCPRFSVIPSYENKESFGDVDILVVCSDRQRCHKLLEEIHRNKRGYLIKPNGTCTSLSVETTTGKQIQVDLIFSNPEEYDFSYSYFSFNDLGNLMGRVSRFLGFKLGHDGLWFVHRNPDNRNEVIDNLLVTRDWTEAISFIGFGEESRFKTLEDIFNFVTKNKYFNKEIYFLENLNHEQRIRDRKRKTYTEFLDFIRVGNYRESLDVSKHEIREQKLAEAFVKFPEFKKSFEASVEFLKVKKESQRLFNGELVNAITGLEGKALGSFINQFKNTMLLGVNKPMSWHEYIVMFTPAEIETRIREYYENRN